jgi:peptidylprolyl isomerase/FKBP-type peptidyl-prolyl cis-trans isomerase FklB
MKAALSPALLAFLLFGACNQGPEAIPVAESTAVLEQNGAAPGVTTLPSGLQYKVVREGPADGYRPKPGDAVKVHYEGRLPSGEIFDSSYQSGTPQVFTVGQLVPGWNQPCS